MAGTLKFVGLEEGLTISLRTDDLTGLSSIQVLTVGERPAAGKDLRPMLKLWLMMKVTISLTLNLELLLSISSWWRFIVHY